MSSSSSLCSWLGRDYAIVPNRGGGDCLFHVMSQATGLSMMQLKRAASGLASREEFQIKRQLYEDAKREWVRTRRSCYLDDILSYGWMEGIGTLAQYRRELARPGRWSDGESIGRLEHLLRCRILLLCARSPTGTYPRPKSAGALPRFYVMVNYINDRHFELITWKGYRCFALRDLPSAIRQLFHLDGSRGQMKRH